MALQAVLFPLGQLSFTPPFDPNYSGNIQPPLYDFQSDLIDRLLAAIALGYTRILVQLPTGGGKTHLAKALLGGADAAQFIVHRKELLEQTSRTLSEGAIPHSFVAAGMPMEPAATLLLCGIATLSKRLGIILPPTLAVWDECHHLGAASWADVMATYPPDTIHIGLTATPERLDGRGLDSYFQIMLCGPTTRELIDRGFLSEFDYFAPNPPDMTGVRSDHAAAEIMDKPKLIGDMVEHYLRLAAGQPGIVFAHSKEHSRRLVDAYNGSGVRAAHIDGDMGTKERSRLDAAFRAREFDILSNCSILGEGYDVPGVVYCGLGRRTLSLSLYLQMVGRPLRIAPGKPRAIIADHAGNCFTHGLPDDDREWSLQGRAARLAAVKGASDATPVRQCLTCYRVSPSFVIACPGCGTEFPSQARVVIEEAGSLSKVDREMLKRKATAVRKAEERNCASHAEFVALHKARGYTSDPNKWARMKISFRNNYARQ